MTRLISGLVSMILGTKDIGPVPITVTLDSKAKDEDVEKLREELRKRGIYTGSYTNLKSIDYKVLSCQAPKNVYEEVFHNI